MSRRGLLAVADSALERAKRKREGKVGLFESPASFSLPELPDDIREVLRGERETLGLYVSGHPLDYLGEHQLQGASPTSVVRESQAGRWVTVLGVVSESWTKPTSKGSVWGGCQVEDASGSCACIAFGQVATEFRDGQVVRARGVTNLRDEQTALKITDLKILERW